MRYLLTILIVLTLYSTSDGTETYYINEIKPTVTREVFSNKQVIDQINKLATKKYKWTSEMVHAGSSKISFYQFIIFFEKKDAPTMILKFTYNPVEKKITDLELLSENDYRAKYGL